MTASSTAAKSRVANATVASPANKPSHVITAILVAINCLIFIFPEREGRNRQVIYRYSLISREVATGYNLTVDDQGCIHDAIGTYPPPGAPLPNVFGIGAPCSNPYDVLTVTPEIAADFRYRTLRPWTTLFTSMFLHQDWLHLIGNMLFLLCFGCTVESHVGPWRFLALYVAAGLLSGLGSALVIWADPHLGLKSIEAILPSLGASGAVAGVMGAYLALHPKNDVYFPPLVGWTFVSLFAVFEVYTAYTSGPFAKGINHLAHVLGFAAGILLVACRANANALIIAFYLFPVVWAIVRTYFNNRFGM